MAIYKMVSRLQTCRVLVCVVLVAMVSGSSGDRSMEFRVCAAQCSQRDCEGGGSLPLPLRILQWSCEENCQYECMHSVTREDIAHGKPVRQFFGKVSSFLIRFLPGRCFNMAAHSLVIVLTSMVLTRAAAAPTPANNPSLIVTPITHTLQ